MKLEGLGILEQNPFNGGGMDIFWKYTTDHFTVVCSVPWPLYGSEATVDLVLIQTSLLLLCRTSCSDAN